MKKLVELDAAVSALDDLPMDYGRWDVDDVLHAIASVPTVDAVPVKHGRWIDIDSETYTWKIRCNKCGHERSMMSTGQIYPMYCEDCGARMDGKDGHEEAD